MGNDLITRRRELIAYNPHIATESGDDLTLLIAEPRIENLTVTFGPIQEGSGTPSPSNVRDFEGRQGVTVNIGELEHTASFSRTILGGTVDLATGILTETTYYAYYSDTANWAAVGSKFYAPLYETRFAYYKTPQISNLYPYAEMIITGSAAVTEDKHFYLQFATGYNRVWVYDSAYATLSGFKNMLSRTPLLFTIPITPQTYQLTAQTINALRGYQSVQSPDGTIEITYWTV